jgi:hypothetical protein
MLCVEKSKEVSPQTSRISLSKTRPDVIPFKRSNSGYSDNIPTKFEPIQTSVHEEVKANKTVECHKGAKMKGKELL